MEKQPDKRITWVIKKFSSLKSKIHSDQFVVGNCKWRLLAYPKGADKANHFALYLAVADSAVLPIGWRRHAKFSVTIVNQFSDKLSQLKETQHWLDWRSLYWGFADLITLTELNSSKGFLVNDELIVFVKVDVLEVVGKLDVSEESSPVMETIDVKGFQVLPSQVEPVNRLFERHQEIASKFRAENLYLKSANMNLLLSLTQTLRQSPKEISMNDLAEKYAAVSYLKDAGFELGWSEKKLGEVKKIKEKEEACLVRLQDLEAQIDKEKAELLAARADLGSALAEDAS